MSVWDVMWLNGSLQVMPQLFDCYVVGLLLCFGSCLTPLAILSQASVNYTVSPCFLQVIAAAKHGFRASGFELNPWLVWYSRYRAWREGVYRSTSFHISDLWKVSFAQYSNVVIFGVPQMMEKLELKLASELPSTAKVVACRFPFPTWIPESTAGEGIDTVWVYDAKTFKSHL
ncbi:ATP synthase subunit C lysine N-methyltransferase isoform X2 [Oreochromis aureus]|uniref:ATP synthase subunit C lysine N-methyltransferase isoform X2 n=1 Tax=Oreochromis aureus TaxID=47969 RepID=UPI001952E752|nr:ATP synthase subunit C lysine N-methyltransferase isoform X2 [Oreochromis aureus]